MEVRWTVSADFHFGQIQFEVLMEHPDGLPHKELGTEEMELGKVGG